MTLRRVGVAATVLVVGFSQFTAAVSNQTFAACRELYGSYPQHVAYDPLGPYAALTLTQASNYNTANTDYWNEGNSKNRAACTFFPGSAQEVSSAVKVLLKYTDVQYALKSGGHNPNFGFSSVNGGILIAFRPNLQSTVISADRSTARVQPGSRWDEAASVVNQYGKAVVGGRLGHVGVAGYLLGGGLSFLTSQYGFASDSVVNYELVLADGSIANANSSSNTDLFYALKGGGNQFGIVTSFTLKTFNIGQVWGGVRTYAGQYHGQLIGAVTNFTGYDFDPKAAIICTFDFTLDDLVSIAVVFFFYDGPNPPESAFGNFNKIPSLSDSTKVQSYPDLLTANNEFSLTDLRYQLREGTYPSLPYTNMTSFLSHHYSAYQTFAFQKSILSLDIFVFSFAIQPIPAKLVAASQAAGGNRLGLDAANGDRIFMEYDVSWVNPLCDNICPGYLEDIVDQLQNYCKTTYAGVKPTHYKSGNVDYTSYNPIFMNDGMYDQPVLQSYGANTYSKLKQIQKSRDPAGFFSKRQGGFKYT